jgi:HTH-type transcriptional regulator/antitoxin HigA
MAAPSAFTLKGKARESYLGLVEAFPLASIRSERHLKAAIRVLDGLLDRAERDPGAALYVDALSDLVATYEDAHHPVPPPSDAELLRYLMEARGVTQAELGRSAGVPKSSISQVLSGKKPLSRAMIGKLAAYFGVEPGVLAANF